MPKTWDAKTVITPDGVRVAVHSLGGRGSPIVLVHAAGLHGRVWTPMAAPLAEAFRCFAPDLRGHGDSAPPRSLDFDWRGFGADVGAVVDGLGLQQPFAMGHSSGATALLLAEEAKPGTFRAIYCFEPVVVAVDPPLGRDPDNWLAARARRRRADFASKTEAECHFATRPPLSSLSPAALHSYVEHGLERNEDGTVRLKCRPEHEALVYEMATAHDCYSRLDQIRCPVTLAWGGCSEAFGPHLAKQLVARLPLARTEVLPGLGHLGPVEDPDVVADSVWRAFSG
ncbi:MAG: alpha/beta hydrolase [Actinomycetota bacterium]|nr:alpha/beta hydrolase [Actinomycetota bacterium]